MPAEYVLVVPTGTQSAASQRALAKDQMVNINGSEDQFYRYKMPQLVCTVPNAHASKMVKTSLCNIDDVSKSLQRPSSYLPNYIGYTVSAKAEYDKKKVQGENCYVSGNYKTEELNVLVTKFIKEWVLCPKCNNPELNMKVKAKKGGQGSIKFDCSACGYSGKQKAEIMTGLPKMTQHIFNNPPSKDTGTQKIEAKQDKEERDAKAESEAAAKKAKKAAKKAKKAAKAKEEGEATPRAGEDDGDEPEPEPEPEPAADAESDTARQERLAKLAEPEPEPETAADPAAALAAVVAGGADPAALEAAYTPLGAAAGGEAVALLLDALFGGGFKEMIKLAKTHAALLSKVVMADAATQNAALGWMQKVGGEKIAAAEKNADKALAKLLHTMYELELLEEEVVLAWHGTCANSAVKEAVQPIIDWLQEESEEDSEED